ncbi:hypothetical protein Hanom_Chr15g01401301 [Helianthus anomalus]
MTFMLQVLISPSEHIVEPIPIHAIPLAAIPAEDWPFVVDFDDDVDVPVFEVDHPDDELGNGEVSDIAILDVPSPVVSVVDNSSDSYPDSDNESFELVTSSALRVAGLEAYPTDDDDAISVVPATPTPLTASTHFCRTFWLVRHIRFASAFPHTPPTHEGDPSGHPHVPPHELSPCLQTSRSFPPSPPHAMPLSDPYHPSHHFGYTRDDLLSSLQLQVEILSHGVSELENEADARRPSPPDYPPPVTPPPTSSPPPTSPLPIAFPPLPIPAPVDGYATRVLTLEQHVSFLICRVHELEDEAAHLRSLVFPSPHPFHQPIRFFIAGTFVEQYF